LYRAATTNYLCYVPVLEDSKGAGRTRLTRFAAAKVIIKFYNGAILEYVYSLFNLFFEISNIRTYCMDVKRMYTNGV